MTELKIELMESVPTIKEEPKEEDVIDSKVDVDCISLEFPNQHAKCEEPDQLDGTDPNGVLFKTEEVYIKQENSFPPDEHSGLTSEPEIDHIFVESSIETNENYENIEDFEMCGEIDGELKNSISNDTSRQEKTSFIPSLCSTEFSTGSDLEKGMCTYDTESIISDKEETELITEKHMHHNPTDTESKEQLGTYANVFNMTEYLNKPLGSNTGSKPFFCNDCGKSFARKRGLDRHMFVHSEDKPFSCSICGRSFGEKTDLDRHINIHTRNKVFFCSLCNKSFLQKATLNRHMNVHLREKPLSSKEALVRPVYINGLKRFLCNQCDKTFPRKNALVRHMNIHTGVKPFSCNKCGISFALNNSLLRHMNTHTGDKPFSCKICGNSYGLKDSLHRHMKIHAGLKPFCCVECDKSFARKSVLVKHMHLHTGSKS